MNGEEDTEEVTAGGKRVMSCRSCDGEITGGERDRVEWRGGERRGKGKGQGDKGRWAPPQIVSSTPSLGPQ